MSGLQLHAYTDGSCYPNPGPGGWAALIHGHPTGTITASASCPQTSNNRMELTAASWVLEHVLELSTDVEIDSLTIVSDSNYVVRGSTEWLGGWRLKEFRKVSNPDLWLAHALLLDRVEAVGIDWSFTWVRGHNGHPENEIVDELAGQARLDKRPLTLLTEGDPCGQH